MLLKVGKLLVAIHTGLPWPGSKVHNCLVPHQVIPLGENFEADVANIVGGWLDVMSLYLVRLEIMELLVADLTHLLSAVGLEDLVDDS